MRIDGGTNVATMTDYLHTKSLDTSWLDDECGSVDESGWFGQIGRWVISVSTYGQRYTSRFPTVALADAEMERLHAVCDGAS